jgi:hypothetical protein
MFCENFFSQVDSLDCPLGAEQRIGNKRYVGYGTDCGIYNKQGFKKSHILNRDSI